MINQILEMAREGLMLALNTKMNLTLPKTLRAEASHNVDFYQRVIDSLIKEEKNG